MTRINVINPVDLLDQHLFAEWKELPRIFNKLRPLKPKEQVAHYKMGKGHMLFFYDKTDWLAKRHRELVRELKKRSYNITIYDPLEPVKGHTAPQWSPNANAYQINLERLIERQNAGKYTYLRQPANCNHYKLLQAFYR